MSDNQQLKPPSLRERAIASTACLPIGNARDNLEQLLRDVFLQLDKRDARIATLESALAQQAGEIETMKAREQWIHDNSATSGGGNGFSVAFFVPVDHEDIFCGIDAAIAKEQA